MNMHKNARLTPKGRERLVALVAAGRTQTDVARALGVSVRTVSKWLKRFREGGADALFDRSSRPARSPHQTPPATVGAILTLRRQRLTGAHIAEITGCSGATVSRVLRRARLSRMRDLDPPPPARRYSYAEPGGLLHLDMKKLARFQQPGHRITGDRAAQQIGRSKGVYAGSEAVHVAIDDASRVAFSQVKADQTKEAAIAHLRAAIRFFKRFGVRVRRVLTDNGSAYRSKAFARACKSLRIKHLRTRIYRPQTNGKAERYIQTLLREWAWARCYPSSQHRARALPDYEHSYNWHRPHSALKAKPPISKLGIERNNLVMLHI